MKLEKTETRKKAVKQSEYLWNQSEGARDVYGG